MRIAHQRCAFTVALWSAASDDYVKTILNFLLPYPWRFIWTSDKCTRRVDQTHINEFYPKVFPLKNLKKVWRRKNWHKNNTLILDDTPHTYKKNYGNAIPILSYSMNNDHDHELNRITLLLNYLKDQTNIRNIEKRHQCAKYPL